MNKLLLLLLVNTSILLAQWKWVNPKPTYNHFTCLSFVDSKTGWAAGSMATLFQTRDGGISWDSVQVNNDDFDFSSLQFFSESKAIALTNHNVRKSFRAISYTFDSGRHWEQIYIDSLHDVNGIFSLNELTHYFFGRKGLLVKSGDSKDSWNKIDINLNKNINGFFARDTMNFWVVTDSNIVLNSTDGGLSWNLKTEKQRYRVLNNIHFVNDTLGFAFGYDFFRTTDGGENWTKFEFATGINPTKIFSFSASDIWLIESSNLHHSTDGGLSWFTKNSGFPVWESVHGIHRVDSLEYTIVGSYGRISHTYNGGVSWTPYAHRWIISLYSIQFVNQQYGICGGFEGKYLKTTNGGMSWSVLNSGTPFNLRKVRFLDENYGFILNDFGEILKTKNGGNSWEKIAIKPKNIYSSIFIRDSLNFVVSGQGGLIVTTYDGGKSWYTRRYGSPNEDVPDIALYDSTGFAVANGGRIFKSTDYGQRWQLNNDLDYFLYSLKLIHNNICIIGGADSLFNSLIIKSTDGGDTWTRSEIYGETYGLVKSITFATDKKGWACNENGQILYTEDSGSTWKVLNLAVSSFNSVFALDSSNVWVVGEGGVMLSTSSFTQVSSLETATVNEEQINFKLYQNFPNPFNPSTRIDFLLQNNSYIIINIFDISGRLIENVYRGFKKAGKHSVFFDGTYLSSGVYFYTIETENFSQTKKMILIR